MFDAVFRHGSVSRASQELGLPQPAASQAVTRLRHLLVIRCSNACMGVCAPRRVPSAAGSGGKNCTEKRHAGGGLGLRRNTFDPSQANQCFRIHLSDIGEAAVPAAADAGRLREGPDVRLKPTAHAHT